MKTIKINFEDFYPTFKKEDNTIINLLREKYDVVIDDNPDYLFYGCFGFNFLNYDCVRIFFSEEDLSPDFNLCDYAIAFDDIKFDDRYLRYPLCFMCESYLIAQNKHIFKQEDIESKTRFCNFVYSNSNANPLRNEFFNKLSEYKKVDSGGRCLNNIGGPVEDKFAFQQECKFTIAFENDSVPNYTTEKIMDAFAAKTIPIYWGDPNVASKFNSKSFINCHNYDSLDDVIKRIMEIDNDDELYKHILAQPIFEDGVVPTEYRIEYLSDFLSYIVEQPLESAKRISKYTFKIYYKNRIKNTVKTYNKMVNIFEHKIPSIGYKFFKKIVK